MSVTLKYTCPEGWTKISVDVRDFNGIETDYRHVEDLTIIAAEDLIINLQDCVAKAKYNKQIQDKKNMEILRKEIEQKKRELESLEKQYTSRSTQFGDIYPTTLPVGGPAETKASHKT